MEEKIAAVKVVKDGSDLEAIKNSIKDMEDAVQKIGAAMYQQANQKQSQQPSEEPKKEEPVEGQYEEVKDNK